MAININDQFHVNAGKAIDSKTGKTVLGKTVPFASTTEANAAINIAYRYQGLTVLIDGQGGPFEYWYTGDLSDGNLILKSPILSAVAFSGDYTDLSNKPSIPTITFDSTPTNGSSNAVTSTGIKSYVDGKVPVQLTVQGDVTSPYLLTYTLSNGYMNRYKNANPVSNAYSQLRVGDYIYNTDASGNLIGILKVTQAPTFNNWDPISGGALDPNGAISIPSHIFDASTIDSNGLPVLDTSWNSTGTTWQLGYVRVNGTTGVSFSTTSGFTISEHPTGPCTIYGGYVYKDPDNTWHPATQHYSYITGIGTGLADSPYISTPSGLPYYGSGILVDSTNFAAYEANNSGEPAGLQLLTTAIGGVNKILIQADDPIGGEMPNNSYVIAKNTGNGVTSIWVNDNGSYIKLPISGQFNFDGSILQAQYPILPMFGMLPTISDTDPTTTDIPSHIYMLWKNTTTGTVKLVYNDNGTLKSTELS